MSTVDTVFDRTFDWVDQIENSNRLKVLTIVLALVVFSALPFLLGGYNQRVATYILLGIILASAYNIIGGLAGYPSFGHAVFIGMGAYSTGILMNRYGVPFEVTILTGGVIAAVFALLTGPPMLRLRGHYFAIATLGLQLAVMRAVNSIPFLGGGTGWPAIVSYGQIAFYFMFLGLAVLTIGLVWLIRRSRFGYGLRALSLNQEHAEMVGVPTTAYKTAAYVVSAIPVGMAGVLFAGWLNFVQIATVFEVELSINMILYVLLGGVGTLVGPIIGAITLEMINQYLWAQYPNLHVLFYGVLIIGIVLFLPGGLAEVWENLRDRYS
ncbi:MAG: branched-chain amino acid ABC transporter permease [Halapricum sp.]|jgi:branched-chain amino acid transport system permease protein